MVNKNNYNNKSKTLYYSYYYLSCLHFCKRLLKRFMKFIFSTIYNCIV